MNLSRMLAARAAEGRPVRVALIGAGKFGSMYLTQARLTTGVQVAAIVDLDPARARLSVVLNHLLADDHPLLLQFDHVTVPTEATSRS